MVSLPEHPKDCEEESWTKWVALWAVFCRAQCILQSRKRGIRPGPWALYSRVSIGRSEADFRTFLAGEEGESSLISWYNLFLDSPKLFHPSPSADTKPHFPSLLPHCWAIFGLHINCFDISFPSFSLPSFISPSLLSLSLFLSWGPLSINF